MSEDLFSLFAAASFSEDATAILFTEDLKLALQIFPGEEDDSLKVVLAGAPAEFRPEGHFRGVELDLEDYFRLFPLVRELAYQEIWRPSEPISPLRMLAIQEAAAEMADAQERLKE